jgi:hypothetical protein
VHCETLSFYTLKDLLLLLSDFHLQRPQQKPSLMSYHHQMPMPGLNGAINQQQVAVLHAPALEAMAPHPHVEGAQGVGDEQAVQVQPVRCFCTAVGDGDGFWEVGQLERRHGGREIEQMFYSGENWPGAKPSRP